MKPGRMLVAGGHPILLRALASFLELYDDLAVVGTAPSAHEALTLASELQPDVVHVLSEGQIVRSGDKSLALELEEKGYDWLGEE